MDKRLLCPSQCSVHRLPGTAPLQSFCTLAEGLPLSHRGFDEQMAALDALKGQPLDAAAIELIRKSITSKSNFLVAKAARLAE